MAVSGPYDARGLLIAAIESNDPVLFLEPKRLYRALKEDVPEERYSISLGQADLARIGKDITLIGWGAQHQQNMAAAGELAAQNISVEVVNLRTLNPLDVNTIMMSVHKTRRCVVAHEAPMTMGFGAEIIATLMETCFLYLEAPIRRCCGLDTPFPHTLEHEYLPDSYKVKQAIIETLNF